MNRITIAQLKAVIDRINREAGTPREPYARDDATGTYRAQPGCYHLSQAYGGYCLEQMSNTSGGVRDVFSSGHIPARDLYNRMHAMLRGMEMKGEKQ